MSDREQSIRPPTVPVPPELQGREPDPPESPPSVPGGSDSEEVVLRHTYRVQILPADALVLERTAAAMETAAREEHDHDVDFPTAIEAAADDLAAIAAYLDWYGDNRGDEIERHEIRLAGAVLDAVPVIGRQAEQLREHVKAGAGGCERRENERPDGPRPAGAGKAP